VSLTNELKEADPNRAIILQNVACAYCGVPFSEHVPFDKEHAVGRRFVPKGTLDGQWNLLLRACKKCNGLKAALENDISAIAMHPDAWGEHVNDDARLHTEARRKAANAISRKTGKPVAAGEQPLKFNMQFGPASFGFTFVMPPQADKDRLFELARYQVGAFFYWITFNEETKRGGFWVGQFSPLLAVRKEDWGNPQMRWFMDTTKDWLGRVHAIGADGYFKITIKRKSATEEIWSWALEWSQNFRLVGFFGREELVEELERTIPELEMTMMQQSASGRTRYRIATPLPEADDILFEVPTAS
jgi:hypothetical protein